MPLARLLAPPALAAALALAPAAQAGGFFIPERGARELGRGGASVASVDTLNAQWLNPAALTRLRGRLSFYVDLGLIHTDQRFERADDDEVMRKDPRYASGFPGVENTAPLFPDPSLALASDFGTDFLVVALGVYGPYAGGQQWPDDGEQRYSLIRLQALAVYSQLSLALKLSDDLSVGVGLQAVSVDLRQRLAISAYPGVFGWAEQRDLDVPTEVAMSDLFTPAANFGVLYRLLPRLELGASLQLPVRAEPEGTLRLRVPDHFYFKDVVARGDAIEATLDFPAIARVGLRVVQDDQWDFELAAVYETWSRQEEIAIRPGPGGIQFDNVPGIGTYTVRPFALRQDYRDTWSLRVGGSWRPLTDLTVRSGVYFETGAPPDRTASVLLVDNDKVGAGLGLTWRVGRFSFDAAAAVVRQQDRLVTNSEKTQVNPLYDADAGPYGEGGPNVVGDGLYQSTHAIFALSASGSL